MVELPLIEEDGVVGELVLELCFEPPLELLKLMVSLAIRQLSDQLVAGVAIGSFGGFLFDILMIYSIV